MFKRNHYFYYYSSYSFSCGGLAAFLTSGYFLVWLRINTALSLYFLLISTESNFFKSLRIEMVKILKFGIAVRGFPWIVNVFNCYKCLSF